MLAAEKLLEGIMDYAFMHSGYLLTKVVVEATMQNIPNIGEFLTHRCVMAKHQPDGMCHNLDLKASFFNFVEASNLRDDDENV